jgi:hypothetical protein
MGSGHEHDGWGQVMNMNHRAICQAVAWADA